MKPRFSQLLLLGLAPLWVGAAERPDSLLAAVAARLPPRPPLAASIAPARVDETVAAILARPDPETFFNRYVFGLQRNATQLLKPAQAADLDALIKRYAPLRTRWHDERNTLRCKFNEVMWRYASADDAAAPALRAELERWMALRMEWTLREQLLYYELDAAVWALLDAPQRRHILAGDWKAHVVLTTGHARENATSRLIVKALGPPAHRTEYDQAVADWKNERAPLHHLVTEAEETARRVGFAMDVNSPALIEAVTVRANDAYSRLFLTEADAYRRLVRKGYRDPGAACTKAAAEAWSEAPTRFTAGAADLIQLLRPAAKS